jgi:hypothetical protein
MSLKYKKESGIISYRNWGLSKIKLKIKFLNVFYFIRK